MGCMAVPSVMAAMFAASKAAFAEAYAAYSLSGTACPFPLASRNWWNWPGCGSVPITVPNRDGSHAQPQKWP
jgi:hypothetical protein